MMDIYACGTGPSIYISRFQHNCKCIAASSTNHPNFISKCVHNIYMVFRKQIQPNYYDSLLFLVFVSAHVQFYNAPLKTIVKRSCLKLRNFVFPFGNIHSIQYIVKEPLLPFEPSWKTTSASNRIQKGVGGEFPLVFWMHPFFHWCAC